MTEISTAEHAGYREWWALAVLVLVAVLISIDGTVLYMAVPALSADIDPSATQLLWIGDIYAFVLAGLLITMGNLSDRIGRKRLLLIGAAAFCLASVLAAFAPNAEMLIIGRTLLGAAGATLLPSTLSIIRAMFSDAKQRRKAVALWAAGAAVGAALGPLVGGVLLTNFWWGSVFLINVPIMVSVLVAGLFLIPESYGDKTHAIDLVSAALSILSIIAIAYAVKHLVGNGLEWSVLAAGIFGLLAGWIFLRRQLLHPSPLLDLSLFRMPSFAGAVATKALSIFAVLGMLFFFSQYLQLVRGYGPLLAGIAELPSSVGSAVAIACIGILAARLGAGRSISAGLATAAVGLAGLGVTATQQHFLGIGIFLAVFGLGVGISMPLSTDAVVSSVPTERAGAASAIAQTAYELGGALGIAILGSLNLAVYRTSLDLPDGTGLRDAAAANDSLAVILAGTEDTAVAEQAKAAFTTAVQTTSLVAALILAIAAAIAWRVIPSPSLARKSA
ncbi:MFS transporter [Nocardia speluncae]|uniref:MFS transporter n=1 Tax=Nocardia speluncae TaxID=419477 RepID=A0A846X6Q1_9NOCA|nr:MFS transporter [Nocardia speluncae]NKY31578.1 MFS transporter [Nocardia speluncae]